MSIAHLCFDLSLLIMNLVVFVNQNGSHASICTKIIGASLSASPSVGPKLATTQWSHQDRIGPRAVPLSFQKCSLLFSCRFPSPHGQLPLDLMAAAREEITIKSPCAKRVMTGSWSQRACQGRMHRFSFECHCPGRDFNERKKKKGLWLEEMEMVPRTCHPDGDRRVNTETVVLMELALLWLEPHFAPGTN